MKPTEVGFSPSKRQLSKSKKPGRLAELGPARDKPGASYGDGGLPPDRRHGHFAGMDPATHDLITRTEPPLRPNGERKLAHNVFMQVTWGLLGVAALGQLFLLIWLDVMS